MHLHKQHGHIVIGQILRIPIFDLPQKHLCQPVRLYISEQPDDSQQAAFAKHLAVGIAGFDQRVGVAEQAVAWLQLDIEVFVLRKIDHAQRSVARRARTRRRIFMRQKAPCFCAAL